MAHTSPQRRLLLGTENSDGTVTGTTGAGTAANPSTSTWTQADASGLISIYWRGVGTITGGTILLEEADWGPLEPPYSGTWSTITSQTASALTGTVQIGLHIQLSAFAYFRVRISSAITGGGSVLVSSKTLGTT